MPPAPQNVRRHFLPWERPLPPQAAEWLSAGWDGKGPLDLSRTLVVVPTRQSGRRLREALAAHAASRGQAVFAPRVLTPEQLLDGPAGPQPASRAESLLAWTEVLRAMAPSDLTEVFPVQPAARGFSWALRLAGTFAGLQATLAEGGLRLADVASAAERGGKDFSEAPRWRELAELERRHDARLRERGRVGAQAARIAASRAPAVPPGIGRIVVLATPDPLPLALGALAELARSLPVEVAVFAPPGEAPAFDDWGRPLAAAWGRRDAAPADFFGRVHLCVDPAAQADRIVALAGGYGSPDGILGVGVADPAVRPALESALGRARFAAFNPEGRPLAGEALCHLLGAMAALAREPDFSAVETLARCPDFIAFLRERIGRSFSPAGWLAGLDQLRCDHLPPDLSSAMEHAGRLRQFPGLAPALAEVGALARELAGRGFAEGALAAPALVFGARRLDPTLEDDRRAEAAATAWVDVVRECAAAAPSLAPAEGWELALGLFGSGARTEDKPKGAVELQGWLELLWEDAPHLAVAGLNDGCVPEAVSGDPFLPESLREAIGLRTNADRFARDAYLLRAIGACRAQKGRLDLLFGKVSAAGDPMRPSRLLLQCGDAELPGRIAFLFREPELAGTNLAWSRAWRLAPPGIRGTGGGGARIDPPARIAVTALRSWLACPFRFYLRHVLRMEPVDPGKSELGAADFGTLCHAALEALGRDEALRDCADPATLREFLAAALDREARVRFGGSPALPLVIQLESARQRLSRAAEVQARERAAGWRILEVERRVSIPLAGLAVTAKIDRIERNTGTGALRVLDYKTSDTPSSPEEAHLKGAGRGRRPVPEFARHSRGGRDLVWADLQLPLYREALAAETGGAIQCGYFNLPRASGETGVCLWEDYTPELHAAALRCAEGVCGAIRAGRFWPPNEEIRPDGDDFAALFHHGVADSVEWGGAAP